MAILAELDEKDCARPRFALASALAYFGDNHAAISLNKCGAAYGLFWRGKLQEAIKLLEPDKDINSSALIHWEGFTKIEEECQRSGDYDSCLEDHRRFSLMKGLLSELADIVFAARDDRRWPAELEDFVAYSDAPPKSVNGWIRVRDPSLLKEATPERLRMLRHIAAKVSDLEQLVLIIPGLAVLLHVTNQAGNGLQATAENRGG